MDQRNFEKFTSVTYRCHRPRLSDGNVKKTWYVALCPIRRPLNHASLMFERDYRSLFRDASRYWDSSVELDSIRYADQTNTNLIVSEIKFRELSPAERKQITSHLLEKFSQSQLAAKFRCQIEVIGLSDGFRALASRQASDHDGCGGCSQP